MPNVGIRRKSPHDLNGTDCFQLFPWQVHLFTQVSVQASLAGNSRESSHHWLQSQKYADPKMGIQNF